MKKFLLLIFITLILFSLFSTATPFAITNFSGMILLKVYANGDDDDGGDDDGGGRRGDDDDEDRNRFNSNDRDLRRLLDLLLQDRDDDDEQEPDAKPTPKTYEGFGLKDPDDKNSGDFNFAAASDFGCSKNTKETISNMRDKKPELVLTLGDLSLDKTATCWLDAMTPLKGKIMITLGYHDVKDGVSKLDQYKEVFGLDNLYYSFDYNRVHFIIMSTLSAFNASSDQYKFIEEDLNKTSVNENIDWIVVTSYGPFYTSPSAHPAKNDIRNIYHPLFDRYGVDLVLHGHNHNYQRTYPVTFNSDEKSSPIVTNGFTTGYNGNNDGIVYAIVGTGGEGFHPLNGTKPYVATQFADKFGFLNVEISNGNPHANLTGTFYDNSGNEVRDYFTIKKEIK